MTSMTRKTLRGWRVFLGLAICPGLLIAANPLGSLKTVPTPEPQNLYKFLKSSGGVITPEARAAALILGKALFWDQAVGSDGQACASCHFNAGADSRTYNQLDPGLRAVPPDTSFTSPFTANYQLHLHDYPFFTPDQKNKPGSDTNDITSSQGVHDNAFTSTDGACPADQPNLHHCDAGVFDPTGVSFIFAPGRNVEPRNTPTTIDAVLNFRNFWDSRARNEFNGVNPLGDLVPTAKVWIIKDGVLQLVRLKNNAFGPGTEDLRLENSSLASQAVGPALSDMEMSYRGRTFPQLGRKMLSLANALPDQHVATNDPVLGPYSRGSDPGLSTTYPALIKAAFQSRWWSGGDVGTGFTQMEANFSLFWGLAIQIYESTLVANNSPFDQAFDAVGTIVNGVTIADPRTCTVGVNCPPGWTAKLQLGLNVFEGKGKCIACHSGPETTNASVRNVQAEKLERMKMGNGQCAVYDNGFYNTAVRRCAGDTYGHVTSGACDDAGLRDENTPVTNLLPMSLFFQLVVAGGDPRVAAICAEIPEACVVPPVINQPGCTGGGLLANEPIAVVGSFKTSGLRNIELTAPYFHNGGERTLGGVVGFYGQGGDFPDINILNLDPNIEKLGLTEGEENALVALMVAMTDERVRCQAPPFDHPELTVPNLPAPDGPTMPATVGNTSTNCQKLQTFQQNLAKP